jgi:hypothetical protein
MPEWSLQTRRKSLRRWQENLTCVSQEEQSMLNRKQKTFYCSQQVWWCDVGEVLVKWRVYSSPIHLFISKWALKYLLVTSNLLSNCWASISLSCHISVMSTQGHRDGEAPWDFTFIANYQSLPWRVVELVLVQEEWLRVNHLKEYDL